MASRRVRLPALRLKSSRVCWWPLVVREPTGASRSNWAKSMLVILPRKASLRSDCGGDGGGAAGREGLGVGVGLGDERGDEEEDLDGVGVEALGGAAGADVLAVGRHGGMPLTLATMVSAWRAANWRPRGEPPAWAMTGRAWTQGPELSGPREA